MTPKEKAEEIYFKMMEHSFGGDSEQSKQCSLILVDEILSLDFIDNIFIHKSCDSLQDYWQQVRKEIENL